MYALTLLFVAYFSFFCNTKQMDFAEDIEDNDHSAGGDTYDPELLDGYYGYDNDDSWDPTVDNSREEEENPHDDSHFNEGYGMPDGTEEEPEGDGEEEPEEEEHQEAQGDKNEHQSGTQQNESKEKIDQTPVTVEELSRMWKVAYRHPSTFPLCQKANHALRMAITFPTYFLDQIIINPMELFGGNFPRYWKDPIGGLIHVVEHPLFSMAESFLNQVMRIQPIDFILKQIRHKIQPILAKTSVKSIRNDSASAASGQNQSLQGRKKRANTQDAVRAATGGKSKLGRSSADYAKGRYHMPSQEKIDQAQATQGLKSLARPMGAGIGAAKGATRADKFQQKRDQFAQSRKLEGDKKYKHNAQNQQGKSQPSEKPKSSYERDLHQRTAERDQQAKDPNYRSREQRAADHAANTQDPNAQKQNDKAQGQQPEQKPAQQQTAPQQQQPAQAQQQPAKPQDAKPQGAKGAASQATGDKKPAGKKQDAKEGKGKRKKKAAAKKDGKDPNAQKDSKANRGKGRKDKGKESKGKKKSAANKDAKDNRNKNNKGKDNKNNKGKDNKDKDKNKKKGAGKKDPNAKPKDKKRDPNKQKDPNKQQDPNKQKQPGTKQGGKKKDGRDKQNAYDTKQGTQPGTADANPNAPQNQTAAPSQTSQQATQQAQQPAQTAPPRDIFPNSGSKWDGHGPGLQPRPADIPAPQTRAEKFRAEHLAAEAAKFADVEKRQKESLAGAGKYFNEHKGSMSPEERKKWEGYLDSVSKLKKAQDDPQITGLDKASLDASKHISKALDDRLREMHEAIEKSLRNSTDPNNPDPKK